MVVGLYDEFNKRWGASTIWIISDTHFGDADLKGGFPFRPDDGELVRRINRKVGRKDVLIHLGDVGDLEYAKQLHGYKILIMGNHDSGKTNYEGIFDEIYEGPLMVGEKLLLSHEPIDVPWAVNIHGHDHQRADKHNVCLDTVNYEPFHLNSFMKKGGCSKIDSLHRATIDRATEKKAKRKRSAAQK